VIAFLSRFWLKCKQYVGVTHLEENMMLGFSSNNWQAQNRVIEGFRCLKVIDINDGFDNWHTTASSWDASFFGIGRFVALVFRRYPGRHFHAMFAPAHLATGSAPCVIGEDILRGCRVLLASAPWATIRKAFCFVFLTSVQTFE
jgi:hypothetical protein